MDRFRAQTLLRLMFEDGSIRCYFEEELGYDEFHKIIDDFRTGDMRNIGSVTDVIRNACEEVEK